MTLLDLIERWRRNGWTPVRIGVAHGMRRKNSLILYTVFETTLNRPSIFMATRIENYRH